MDSTAYALIGEGDWVSGTSPVDEKFMGFVLSIPDDGNLRIRVTYCDRKAAVGTVIEAKRAKVRKMPEYAPSAAEEVHSLIELALSTHDKEWFDALSAQLRTLPAAEPVQSGNQPITKMKGSRL